MSLLGWSDTNYLNFSLGSISSAAIVTMMGWVRLMAYPAGASVGTLFEIADTTNNTDYDLHVSSTGLLGTWNGKTDTSSGVTLQLYRWYHLAMTVSTINTGVTTPYVNGVAKTASGAEVNIFTNGDLYGFFIGRDSATGSAMPAGTMISAVKFWNGVSLTALQVKNEWKLAKLKSKSSQFAQLPMIDPGFGGRDFSGLGNNFTLNGTLRRGPEPTLFARSTPNLMIDRALSVPAASSFTWQQLTQAADLISFQQTEIVGY